MEKINDVKIIVPSKITLTDGTIERSICFETTEQKEYIKLCMSLGAYEQEGVIIASKV